MTAPGRASAPLRFCKYNSGTYWVLGTRPDGVEQEAQQGKLVALQLLVADFRYTTSSHSAPTGVEEEWDMGDMPVYVLAGFVSLGNR